MTDYVEYIPKSFPIDLLQKDWSKRKFYLRENEIEAAHKLHDLEVREDDVWLVTLPHSGEKFMKEVIWLILNNYDFESAKKENSNVKTQHLELNENLETILDLAENLKSPRLISTHLPLPMLPAQVWRKKPKLIYVYRDPIDAQVSFYLKNRKTEITKNKSIEEFFSDNMDRNSPFEHVTEFYALRNEPWVYYTSFEQKMSNLPEVITQMVEFLEKTITDSQMERMLQYFSNDDNSKDGTSSIGKIWRKIKRVFERKRFENEEKIGISKTELSPELYDKYEKWIEDELNKLNVTLHELLLINNDTKSEKLNDKDNSNNEIFKEKDNSINHDEKVVGNDSNDNMEVEKKSISDNEKNREKVSSIIEASNHEVEEKKDITDNAEIEKKHLNDNTEVGKNDNNNKEIEKKNSNANAEIANDNAKFEDKDEKDKTVVENTNIIVTPGNVSKIIENNEVEKDENKNNEKVEIKGDNDTHESEKTESNDNENVQKEVIKHNAAVKPENNNSSENVEINKTEKKESEVNEEESTYL